MVVGYDVKSDVIDIRKDIPKSSDVFFVDTNVWYWQTYSKASSHKPSYQVRDYPIYIKKILNVHSKLYRCDLILAEISHIIEKSEFEIFCDQNSLPTTSANKKIFRHNYSIERSNVILEVETAWDSIQKMSETFDIVINDAISKEFMKKFQTLLVDGYDLHYLIGILQLFKKPSILTDDGDFSSIPNITLFTANDSVISAANRQGKLLTR